MLDEKEFNLIFSNNLIQYMLYYGINQKQLSKALKVAPSTINSWVHAQRTPRMDKVDAMCKIFHCKRSDLIAEEFNAPAIGEDELLKMYRSLNAEGKAKARELVKMLVDTGQYKKHSIADVV